MELDNESMIHTGISFISLITIPEIYVFSSQQILHVDHNVRDIKGRLFSNRERNRTQVQLFQRGKFDEQIIMVQKIHYLEVFVHKKADPKSKFFQLYFTQSDHR